MKSEIEIGKKRKQLPREWKYADLRIDRIETT